LDLADPATHFMNARTFLGLVTLLLATAASQAQHIYIRVSVKVITDPVTGARPSGITDDLFSAAMASANQWMDSFGRGYRFNVTEILNIGGPTQGGASGPSQMVRPGPACHARTVADLPKRYQYRPPLPAPDRPGQFLYHLGAFQQSGRGVSDPSG